MGSSLPAHPDILFNSRSGSRGSWCPGGEPTPQALRMALPRPPLHRWKPRGCSPQRSQHLPPTRQDHPVHPVHKPPSPVGKQDQYSPSTYAQILHFYRTATKAGKSLVAQEPELGVALCGRGPLRWPHERPLEPPARRLSEVGGHRVEELGPPRLRGGAGPAPWHPAPRRLARGGSN